MRDTSVLQGARFYGIEMIPLTDCCSKSGTTASTLLGRRESPQSPAAENGMTIRTASGAVVGFAKARRFEKIVRCEMYYFEASLYGIGNVYRRPPRLSGTDFCRY
jgi:hypothetical protein